MVFSSNIFLFFFLPAVLVLYYLCPRKARNTFLLVASLVFYGWGEPRFLPLMILVILINYVAGILIDREQAKGKNGKPWLIAAIIGNLAVLGYFKYAAFLVKTWNSLTPGLLKLPIPEILLPLGISFYVFQSMSYTIDVYRGGVSAQKNPLLLATYIAMFPQLIAGPIVRYRDIEEQLKTRRENPGQFASGIHLFIIGLSKKLLLANHMGALWEALKGTEGSPAAWICMFAYTLQIYFDFSGYSDMAIGLGRMLGFEFLKNFDYPYISHSITEFWRRWHISLGSWFREYVYIPLGGNRKGSRRQLLNLLIVWGLTGLWHGASWNFVLWGLYYGLLLIFEKRILLQKTEKLPAAIKIFAVLILVSFGWALFSFTDLGELGLFMSRLFSFRPDSMQERNLILAYLPLMLTAAAAATPWPGKLCRCLGGERVRKAGKVLLSGLLLLLCIAALASQSYNPFIYFRF